MRILKNLAIATALAYAGFCGLLYFSQDSMLYYPTAESFNDDARAFALHNDGLELKVWRIGRGDKALLYFGGNGEDVAQNIPRLVWLFDDYTVYLMNYRGFGGSDGQPDETGFYSDADALFGYVSQHHDTVSVIGRSLGSGVATWLAAEHPVERLVLVTPFDSVENVAKAAYPFAPVSLLLRDKFRSIDRVDRIDANVLILVAYSDNVVPHANTMALASSFSPEQLRVRTIDDTNHRSIARSPVYPLVLSEFLLPGMDAEASEALSAP